MSDAITEYVKSLCVERNGLLNQFNVRGEQTKTRLAEIDTEIKGLIDKQMACIVRSNSKHYSLSQPTGYGKLCKDCQESLGFLVSKEAIKAQRERLDGSGGRHRRLSGWSWSGLSRYFWRIFRHRG